MSHTAQRVGESPEQKRNSKPDRPRVMHEQAPSQTAVYVLRPLQLSLNDHFWSLVLGRLT